MRVPIEISYSLSCLSPNFILWIFFVYTLLVGVNWAYTVQVCIHLSVFTMFILGTQGKKIISGMIHPPSYQGK